MTSKGRNAVRLETEIEKCREESRWNRVIELAEQLKQRSPNQGNTQQMYHYYTHYHKLKKLSISFQIKLFL